MLILLFHPNSKTEQGTGLIKQFDCIKIKCPSEAFTTSHQGLVTLQDQIPQTSLSSSPNEQVNRMSISAADCNILSLPKAVLQGMWDKANKYLQSKIDVVAAPESDPKAKMVTSHSGSLPHFVQVVSPGHYIGDKNCLQWSSSQTCSHSLVAAEVNGGLKLFLLWYTSNDSQPKITQIAMTGLPSRRDRKCGAPEHKSSRTPVKTPYEIYRDAIFQS